MISNASESFFSNMKVTVLTNKPRVTHPEDQISASRQTSRESGLFTQKLYVLFIHLIKKDWYLVTYP